MPKRTKKAKAVNKMDLWLFHFLNESNSKTFLNRKESARAAGYSEKNPNNLIVMGHTNYIKQSEKIEKWLDDEGLSEKRLKEKLLALMDAKETKFFQKDGKVTDEREVEALETQRRTLDMALKIKGTYAPEKHHVSFDEVKEKLISGRKRASKNDL